MSAEKKLQDAGVDMQEVLERLMGSEALLKRLFGKFLADDNMVKLKGALARNAIEEATLASHTLKGVCANLSMHRLQQLFSDQVEALRRGDEASAPLGNVLAYMCFELIDIPAHFLFLVYA